MVQKIIEALFIAACIIQALGWAYWWHNGYIDAKKKNPEYYTSAVIIAAGFVSFFWLPLRAIKVIIVISKMVKNG